MNQDNLPPCPRCGAPVEWTNSRDRNVLESYITCTNTTVDELEGYDEPCDEVYFLVETLAFKNLPDKDYESACMKYRAWCATNPKGYRNNEWQSQWVCK
jgi:hypothetical protein